MEYIAKHQMDRNEFLGSDVFDHEYHDPQVCTADANCLELARVVGAFEVAPVGETVGVFEI